MAKKNDVKNGSKCWCYGTNGRSLAITLILIGVAYALQNSGVLFSNIVLWPWVLIALGICIYLFRK